MQQKKTHTTPGPWYVREQDDVSEGNGYVFAVKAEAHGSYIQNPGHANSEANARLMAAAPEMLLALQKITRRIEVERDDEAKEGGSGVFLGAAILPELQAAIAKAQGAPE
jgi:hypothetical protein